MMALLCISNPLGHPVCYKWYSQTKNGKLNHSDNEKGVYLSDYITLPSDHMGKAI